jgi:hypothetical protein
MHLLPLLPLRITRKRNSTISTLHSPLRPAISARWIYRARSLVPRWTISRSTRSVTLPPPAHRCTHRCTRPLTLPPPHTPLRLLRSPPRTVRRPPLDALPPPHPPTPPHPLRSPPLHTLWRWGTVDVTPHVVDGRQASRPRPRPRPRLHVRRRAPSARRTPSVVSLRHSRTSSAPWTTFQERGVREFDVWVWVCVCVCVCMCVWSDAVGRLHAQRSRSWPRLFVCFECINSSVHCMYMIAL